MSSTPQFFNEYYFLRFKIIIYFTFIVFLFEYYFMLPFQQSSHSS